MLKKKAYSFIILLGLISLFADVTYEGARSITGPYLAIFGASATVVGFVAGFGELIGYGLRLLSGYIADRTKRYWAMTLTGYAVNLLAVPLLALAGNWQMAVILMMTERMGKAIRSPARDAILSHAAKEVGSGWGFGLHEAMDQIGAVLGPVLMAAVLTFGHSYRTGFAVLLIPALLALVILVTAKYLYPSPQSFETTPARPESGRFPKVFWFYLAAVALIAAGYADFPLMAYHCKKVSIMSDQWIPLLYAIAMAVDAVAALIFGRLFDRFGVLILMIAGLLSAFFAPFVFWGNFNGVLTGIILWGIGMGAQESVLRATVAVIIPSQRRAWAYGIFNSGYGLFWFLGSALMGVLYDRSIALLVGFSVLMQLVAIPVLFFVRKNFKG